MVVDSGKQNKTGQKQNIPENRMYACGRYLGQYTTKSFDGTIAD